MLYLLSNCFCSPHWGSPACFLLTVSRLSLVSWDFSEKPGPGRSGVLWSHLWLQMAEAGHCLRVATLRCLIVTTAPSYLAQKCHLCEVCKGSFKTDTGKQPLWYTCHRALYSDAVSFCVSSPVFWSSFLLLVF